MEKFDWKSVGGREIYDTLPSKLKEEMKLYWRNNTKINNLVKEKQRYNDEIKTINLELQLLRKSNTKSLPNIRYTKRNFIPTIYKELDEDWSDYSINKFKMSLRDIIESVIMDFIDITNIKSLFEVGNKLSFNNVLEKYKSKKIKS